MKKDEKRILPEEGIRATEEKRPVTAAPEQKEEKIDVRKLIIYSEIMKPKWQEN